MNRRTFLQTTSAALAASALTPLAHSADAPAKKRPLKKAVNLGMVKGEGSVPDKFKMVKDAGFDGIELNLPDDSLSVDIINQAKAASGLEVAGIICTPHWKFPLSDPDPAKRERTVNRHRAVSRRLPGAPVVVQRNRRRPTADYADRSDPVHGPR